MHKTIRICCAAVVVCISVGAGFLCGMKFGQTSNIRTSQDSIISTPDTIETFRTQRRQQRQMQLSQLNEIIHDENSDPEIISLAQHRQIELMQWAEQELILEEILHLRGFDDASVTVNTNSVNIMIRGKELSHQQTALILEAAARETGISAGNIKIIPIN